MWRRRRRKIKRPIECSFQYVDKLWRTYINIRLTMRIAKQSKKKFVERTHSIEWHLVDKENRSVNTYTTKTKINWHYWLDIWTNERTNDRTNKPKESEKLSSTSLSLQIFSLSAFFHAVKCYIMEMCFFSLHWTSIYWHCQCKVINDGLHQYLHPTGRNELWGIELKMNETNGVLWTREEIKTSAWYTC